MRGSRWAFGIWLGVAAVAAAAPSVHEFTWRAEIRGTWGNGDLCSVPVDAGVLAHCRAFPMDVRIVDDSGAEWPFFVRRDGGPGATLVTEAQSGGPVFLLFGSDTVAMPRYDLARRIGTSTPALVELTVEKRERNPARKIARLWDYGREMLMLLAVVFVALGAMAALRKLRQGA